MISALNVFFGGHKLNSVIAVADDDMGSVSRMPGATKVAVNRRDFVGSVAKILEGLKHPGAVPALLVLPLAGCGGGGTTAVDDAGDGGIVFDGYLVGATVYREGSDSSTGVTTATGGVFESLTGSGDFVVVGGTDASTGLAFTGQLKAPDGYGVVSPLTTMVEALVASGTDATTALANVTSALGLTGVDLSTLDPIATGNTEVFKAGVQVSSMLATASSGSATGYASFASSLASALKAKADAGGSFDVSDGDSMSSLADDFSTQVTAAGDATLIATLATQLATIKTTVASVAAAADISSIASAQSTALSAFADQGIAVKGPLHNAIVFNDYNGDGELTYGESWTTTNEDGSYAITKESNILGLVAKSDNADDYDFDDTDFDYDDYSIVVSMGSATLVNADGDVVGTVGGETIDYSSGESYTDSGVSLKAAPGGGVITPLTTLHEHSEEHADSFQVAELAAALGIDSSVDILNFNTHADGVDEELAHQVETIKQHLMTTTMMVQAAIQGSGTPAEGTAVSTAVAHDAALDSLIKLIIEVHNANNEEGGSDEVAITGDLDLSDHEHLEELEELIEADLADINAGGFGKTMLDNGTSVPTPVLEYVVEHASHVINLINSRLDELGFEDFGSIEAGAISHLKHDIADQIEAMATAARAHYDAWLADNPDAAIKGALINLLTDSTFDGTDTWAGNAYNPVDGVNAVDVEAAGNPWDVQLSQAGVELVAGQAYTLMFDASSESGRAITAGIGQAGAPYSGNTETVTLGAETDTYVLHLATDFAMIDAGSRAYFDFGDAVGDVALDNVRLFAGHIGTASVGIESLGTDLISDGTFDGTDTWTGNAYNPVGGVNVASVATAGNAYDLNLSGTVNLTGGQLYTLTFDVSGEEGRTMIAGIGQSSGNYWGNTETVTISAESQTVTLHLVAANGGAAGITNGEYFGGETSRVLFDMGADTGAVNIDNVSLVQGHVGTATGTVYDFDAGTADAESGIREGGDWEGFDADAILTLNSVEALNAQIELNKVIVSDHLIETGQAVAVLISGEISQAFDSFEEAYEAAVDGDTIELGSGEHALTDGSLTIEKELTIKGANSGVTFDRDQSTDSTAANYDADTTDHQGYGYIDSDELVLPEDGVARAGGAKESYINGSLIIASDNVSLDGLRLDSTDGPLLFDNASEAVIDNFSVKNSYIIGYDADNAPILGSGNYVGDDLGTNWLIQGNIIGGVVSGTGGSMYLSGITNTETDETGDLGLVGNMFWRPAAGHLYLSSLTDFAIENNNFYHGLHADGADLDGLLSDYFTSTSGYSSVTPYGYGYGADGSKTVAYGADGEVIYYIDAQGRPRELSAEDGYGAIYTTDAYGAVLIPYGYGGTANPDGFIELDAAAGDTAAIVESSSDNFYGRNYWFELKGVNDGITITGNTGAYNSGGIQFYGEEAGAGDVAYQFDNITISNNLFTEMYNADPNGLMQTVYQNGKSGLLGPITISLNETYGASAENISITGNIIDIPVNQIYGSYDYVSGVQVRGDVAGLAITSNTITFTNTVDADGNLAQVDEDDTVSAYNSVVEGIKLIGGISGAIDVSGNTFGSDLTATQVAGDSKVELRVITVDGSETNYGDVGSGDVTSLDLSDQTVDTDIATNSLDNDIGLTLASLPGVDTANFAVTSGDFEVALLSDLSFADTTNYFTVLSGSNIGVAQNVTGFTSESTINVADMLQNLGYSSISSTKTASANQLVYQADSSLGQVYETNLLTDSTFDGTDTWAGNAYNPVDGVNAVDVEAAGNPWDVQLSQAGVELVAGQAYTLMFDASSESGRAITAGIGQAGAPYSGNTETVTLGAETDTYVLHLATDFAMIDAGSRAYFDFGDAVGDVALDNVRLFAGHIGTASVGIESLGTDLISDGTFDGTDTWTGNAYNPVGGVNVASVATAGNAYDLNLSGTVNLTGGQLYTLTFDVSGEEGRTMIAGIGQSSGNYWGNTETVTISAESQTVTLHLVAANGGAAGITNGEYFGGETSRVLFDMGADTGAVNIDNVSLVQGHVGTATGTEAPTSIATDLGDNQLRADGRLVDTDSDGVNDSTLVTLLYDADSSLGSIEYSYRQMYLDGDVTDTVLLDGLFNYDTLVLNAAPAITSDHVTSVNEDSAYSYAITAVDAEGTNVTLSVTLDGAAIPDSSWLSFSNNTLSGTPDNDDVGTYALAVTALDEDGQSATETFTLTVVNTNDAPVLTITPDTTAAQGEAYTQTFSIADVDVGDEVDGTVTVNGVDITADDYDGSSWLSITDNEDGSFTLSGTPTVAEAGTTQTVVITASDGEATDTETVAIAVSEPTQYLSFDVSTNSFTNVSKLVVSVDIDALLDSVSDSAATPYFYGGSFSFTDTDGTAFDEDIFTGGVGIGANDTQLGTSPFATASFAETSAASSGEATLVLANTSGTYTFDVLGSLAQASDGTIDVAEVTFVELPDDFSMQVEGTFTVADLASNATTTESIEQVAFNVEII